MWKKDLLTIADLERADILECFKLSAEVKSRPQDFRTALAGKTLGMIFHKSSTRTRVSFETGIYQLGGLGMYFNQNELQLGRGETVSDTAKVLSRYIDAIMIRTYKHSDVETLARHATIPAINGLTDTFHPCQGLTDYFTMSERFGKLDGLKVAYIGDGSSNVSNSLMMGAALLGVHLNIVAPAPYHPAPAIMERAQALAAKHGAKITVIPDPKEGLAGAKVIYTDVWTSMGQEAESEKRRKDLAAYQVNPATAAYAGKDWIFMHCLPAHRGEEVVDAIADDPRSVIFDQAENRLHVQKAIMLKLLKAR